MNFLKLILLLFFIGFIVLFFLKKEVSAVQVFDLDYIAEYQKILPSNCIEAGSEAQFRSIAKNMLVASHSFIKNFRYENHSNPLKDIQLILQCYITDIALFMNTYNPNIPAEFTKIYTITKTNEGLIILDAENPIFSTDLRFPLVILLKFLIISSNYLNSLTASSPELINTIRQTYTDFMLQDVTNIYPSSLESYLKQEQNITLYSPIYKNNTELVSLNNLLKKLLPQYPFLGFNNVTAVSPISICNVINSTVRNIITWITGSVKNTVAIVKSGSFDSKKLKEILQDVNPATILLSNITQLYNRYNFIFSKLKCTVEDIYAKNIDLGNGGSFPITKLIENPKFRYALMASPKFFKKLGTTAHLVKMILLLGLAKTFPISKVSLDEKVFTDIIELLPCDASKDGISVAEKLLQSIGSIFSDSSVKTSCSLLEVLEKISTTGFSTSDAIKVGPILQALLKEVETSGPIALDVFNKNVNTS
jgi:hypothetical protein